MAALVALFRKHGPSLQADGSQVEAGHVLALFSAAASAAFAWSGSPGAGPGKMVPVEI